MKDFKVRCVKAFSSICTKGEIYEVKNRKLTFERGAFTFVNNFEQLNKYLIDYGEFELVKEPQPGTKTWLMKLMKDGFVVVEDRGGSRFLATSYGMVKENKWNNWISFKEDLTHSNSERYKNLDIVKVYSLRSNCIEFINRSTNLLWQREEDIDPMEIKEWLEEFTGEELRIDEDKDIFVDNDLLLYCENKKELWINELDYLGVYDDKKCNWSFEFKTHKEALQWLKDNLVKPEKELTIEERLERLERHTNLK